MVVGGAVMGVVKGVWPECGTPSPSQHKNNRNGETSVFGSIAQNCFLCKICFLHPVYYSTWYIPTVIVHVNTEIALHLYQYYTLTQVYIPIVCCVEGMASVLSSLQGEEKICASVKHFWPRLQASQSKERIGR